MECLLPTLAPHEAAPMHYVFHLPCGQYEVTFTLQTSGRVLDIRTGHLTVEERNGVYGTTWHEG